MIHNLDQWTNLHAVVTKDGVSVEGRIIGWDVLETALRALKLSTDENGNIPGVIEGEFSKYAASHWGTTAVMLMSLRYNAKR